VDEGVIFGRVKLRNAGFAKVFELDLAAHELAHVILKRFGTESDLRRKGCMWVGVRTKVPVVLSVVADVKSGRGGAVSGVL
jgi:hypothetical protein